MASVRANLFISLLAGSMTAAATTPANVLPKPTEAFNGKIGTTYSNSSPFMPKSVTAPKEAPNVLLVLTDDVGFGATSTFGGAVPTPNLDKLAAHGLKYNRFHTTAMCSPTRAALLTGRNAHAVSAGSLSDLASGYPGYWSMLPDSAATIAEILRQNGYSTAMFGKHHNLASAELSTAGPFDRWPSGLGFDYFYGFLGGGTDQWRPNLYRNHSPAEPKYQQDPNYILDRDLVDEALHWIYNQQAADSDKPFFVYFAPGSAHAPHQAPKEWIAKFEGQFDQGWDVLREESFARQKKLGVIPADTRLTPRPQVIPAWNSLSADQRRIYARMMEVYAAMLAYQDHEFGRLMAELERMGESDNTLVIFIEGDNGGSAEGGLGGTSNDIGRLINGYEDSTEWLTTMLDELGGPRTQQHFPVGWAWGTNTPFQWTKQVGSHFGGTRNGLVISWPTGIDVSDEQMRSQFAHVTDIMPTILEAVGLPTPDRVNGVDQQPIDGVSLAYSFDNASAPEQRTTQYFELLANRAIYHDGWMANTTPQKLPWESNRALSSPMDYQWELYHVDEDFSQSRDLSAKYPRKLAELQALFDREAKRNHVYPLDDRLGGDRSLTGNRSESRTFVYWAKNISVPAASAPQFPGQSFSVIADIVVTEADANGVLVATGSQFGGWSLSIENGKPVLHYAFSSEPENQFEVRSNRVLQTGAVKIRMDFNYDGADLGGSAKAALYIGDRRVGSGRIGRTFLTTAGYQETFDIGRDTGVPVKDGSRAFNGEIRKVEVQVH